MPGDFGMEGIIMLRISTLTLFIVVSSLSAATIQVPSDHLHIQDAIDAAANGDTVLVAPGTYVENIDFLGKAITVASESGPLVTVLDGGDPVEPKYGCAAKFVSGEKPDSVLEGFTITNGTGYYVQAAGGQRYGGGVFCTCSPTLKNNIITGNEADEGGGICCLGSSSPEIIGNEVSDNHATEYGGGICCKIDDAVITDCTIKDNSSGMSGGGIYFRVDASYTMILDRNVVIHNQSGSGGGIACDGNNMKIANSRIAENLAGSGGGGISSSCTHLELSNNVIFKNRAEGPISCGGGLEYYDGILTLTNNVFYENEATTAGGGIHFRECTARIANSVFWKDAAEKANEIYVYSYSGNPVSHVVINCSVLGGGLGSVYVQPGSTLKWGPGMIDADPLFVDPDAEDYHLTFNSPCRASGDNTAVGLPGEDFEGDPRIAYGTVDIGADEFYTHLYYTGDATPGGYVEGKLTGLPGSAPVFLWFGSGLLTSPVPTVYGNWYLELPLLYALNLGSIPSNGVVVLPAVLQLTPPAPYDLNMQAFIGDTLTNPCVMEIR
jgi:parallel beta-helix repeat protein